MKDPEKVNQGKRNRRMGADTEKRTRLDLESKGWIVCKWANNIKFTNPKETYINCLLNNDETLTALESNTGKCVPASPGRFRMMSTGFPDFIAYRTVIQDELFTGTGSEFLQQYKDRIEFNSITNEVKILPKTEIMFIECKTNGQLSKIEKEKAQWYLDNNYCSKFYIASREKIKNRVHIIYTDFKDLNTKIQATLI